MKDKKRKNNDRPTRNTKRPRTYKEDSDSEEDTDDEQDKLIEFLSKFSKENDVSFTVVNEDEEEEENIYTKYLNKLSKKKRNKLRKLEDKILKFNTSDIPLRYKILESDLENKVKAQLLQKAIHFENLSPVQGEYYKLKRYMDGILKIPFKKLKSIPVKAGDDKEKLKIFMNNIKSGLDNCIYSQETAKQSIMQILAKWITNPESTGNIIGLCGPPGVGKTSLIKNGLAKTLDMPFSFISLGGSTNASILDGFDYTYEGSKWGKIVDTLMINNCMNPIIFFDELDKISETKAGEEIASILIHLTDATQNNSFSDRYFSGIEFDLSKAFLIFSFNDINKIHPVLKDRITVINLEGFNVEDKINIAKKFSIPRLLKNVGMKNNITIPDETLRIIINTYCPEKGIRKLEKCLETLIMKINLYDMTKDIKNLSIKGDIKLTEPYDIDTSIVTKLLDPVFRKDDMTLSVKMMYS